MPAPGYRPPKTPKPKPQPRAAAVRQVDRQKGTAAFPSAAATARSYGKGPVSVYTSPRAAPGTQKTVKQAGREWNKAAGSKIFKPTTNRKKADVVVSTYKGVAGSSLGGYTNTSKKRGKPTRVALDQRWAGSSPNLAAHELGHAAGLAHPNPSKSNEYRNSRRIMGSGLEPTHLEARAAAKIQRSRKLKVTPKERTARRAVKKRSR